MPVPTILLWLRITARVSGSVFLLAFVAPGLAALWKSALSQALYRARNRTLLLFTLLHTVHLGFVIFLAATMGRVFFQKFPAAGLAAGGLIYVLIYCLTLAAVADVRARFPLIYAMKFQSVALYTIWVTFAVAYTANLKGTPALAPLVLAAYAAIGIRIIGGIAERRRGQQRSAASA